MPSDLRILGPQVKNGEEGRGMESRRERGELGRREGMEKGVARPNDISDALIKTRMKKQISDC
jgi:hypothetical protein